MKKLISPLLLISLLCSCADKTEDYDPYNERLIEGFPNVILHLDSDGIKLVNDGKRERLYTINGDFQALLNDACKSISSDKPPVQYITINDFDFDGYQDLFIPEMLGTPNIPGTYYHFNSEKFRYDQWDEMNSLGVLVKADSDEKTISCSISSSAVNHENTVYKWHAGSLVPISREVQYADAHNDVYIDYYEYDENSKEILTRREIVILDADNNWLGTEEIIVPRDILYRSRR